MDFNKRHREAVSALIQARCEREEMGAERREGLRKRVKEMEMSHCAGGGHPPEAETEKGNDSEVRGAGAASSPVSAEKMVSDDVREAPTSPSIVGTASCPSESNASTSASSPS